MNKQEIENYNRLCAEFLGWKLISKEDFNKLGEASYTGESKDIKWGIIEYLKFHSDWNCIMEVVEAMEKLGVEYYLGNKSFAVSYTLSENNWYAEDTIVKTDRPTKEAVVQAINQFLIWYNNEQNNT